MADRRGTSARPDARGARRRRGAQEAVDARPLPAALDRARHGSRARPRQADPQSQRRPRQAAGRHRQPADRARPAADDVPGAGEGPLRGARSREDRRRLRPALLRRVVVPLVGDRAAVHVHAGLALPRRPARLPHRRDHRRPRALHRDGADLERPRQGRPRPGGGARRLQRALPGRRVLAARLLLSDRPARLARPGHAGLRGRHLGGRAHSADLPRHPAHRRIPHPPDRAEAQGTRLVRQPLPAEDRPDHPVRAAVHDRGAVRDPGRHDHLAAAGRRDDRAAAARLLRGHVGRRVLDRQADRLPVPADGEPVVHRRVERLRAGDRRRRRGLRRRLRARRWPASSGR